MKKKGNISRYLECKTRSHKTSRLVARGGRAMPLVAPIWGVTSPLWGLTFMKFAQLADNRQLESLDHEPLFAAPNLTGGWSSQAVTTKEAGMWVKVALPLALFTPLKPRLFHGVPSEVWIQMSGPF